MFRCENIDSASQPLLRLIDTEADSSATIVPDYGFNCISFVCPVAGQPCNLLYASPTFPSPGESPSGHGTPILAPFPNRIRKGKYSYAGRSYQLPCNEAGKNAIHGFVIDRRWHVTGQGGSTEEGAWVRGELQISRDRADYQDLWPEDFLVAFTYRLKGPTLQTDIEIENPGSQPLPFGLGTHPYFRFPIEGAGSQLADCEIVSPMRQYAELIECLPTGQVYDVTPENDLHHGMRFDQRSFDGAFTGAAASNDGLVTHLLRDHLAGVELAIQHSMQFGYVVIYTPPHRQAICIEPYTCLTDAINLTSSELDTGLWHLQPGERRTLTIRYEARRLG